jgi:hypothetical protein
MTLESTQPPTEMNTRNVPGGKGRPPHKADNFTAICEPIVKKIWEPRRLTTLLASMAFYKDSFTFYLCFIKANVHLTMCQMLWACVEEKFHAF